MRSIIICCMSMPARQTRAATKRWEGAAPHAPKRRLTSRELLAGRDEVIEHARHEYHLRHTRAGKLILIK
jgi:hemin uptake protein HemP